MPGNEFALVSLGQFGDRARAIQVSMREAALVIGLGQVGMQAVGHTYEMLAALLTRRDMQNNVRLLAMARRRSIREETRLPREARLALNMDQIAWSDVPGRYAQIGVAQWWPHSPRDPQLHEDPAQVRAYSRLMMFHNAGLISETLFKLARWLRAAGTGRSLNLTRTIYVLASLAEPEGSGMIFDTVSRLRALVADEPTRIMGIFSLRAPQMDHDSEGTRAMANVYATLREIDAYTLHPEAYPSTLPVIGHSLSRGEPRPALDMVFLTDDMLTPNPEPPANGLAECVTTWIAASLGDAEHAPLLPPPIQQDPTSDRLTLYSTFGVSKLALPTHAAMSLAAVGLAQTALRAVKTAHAGTSTGGWADTMLKLARTALLEFDVVHDPEVETKVREWQHKMNMTALSRQVEQRASRGENARLVDVAQGECRRLEREMASNNPSASAAQTDTIRTRMDIALEIQMRQMRETLLDAPVRLAYAEGYGLIWTVSAFEELERLARNTLPPLKRTLDEAEVAFQNARQAFFEMAQQHQETRGGFRGQRKAVTAQLDSSAETTLIAAVNLIAAQAQLEFWTAFRELVENVITQVRDVIPLVDQAAQSLNEFETICRQAMGRAANQPPRFPVGALLNEDWYLKGVEKINNLGQLPARDLVERLYAAWGGGGLPPERRLSGFLFEIRDAARRTLTGTFAFSDLYQFFSQNEANPIFQQALSALPGAATPAMVPRADDHHPPALPYEIVREAPRSLSAMPAPQQGVRRSYVASPDPDEITVIRVLHGTMAEALPPMRETYRRAYDRAGAEGMPMHVDRRWDSTMADLVHTSARREISMIWENMLTALRQNPRAVQPPLNQLTRAFAVALDVSETLPTPPTAQDWRLAVYKLRPFRLKLPPPHCAILFLYSNRSAEELSKEIFHAMTQLPLEEQFAFVVNITRRADLDDVLEPLRHVDFTILVLQEGDVKHLIGARLPTRALSDLVLGKVSLTTVSPFFTRGPVPEHMFFGREREIAEVRSKLRTHSVALIGGRRIGKTSTLQRIQRLLEPTESDYIPYYLDCHGAANYRSFFWLINRRWGVAVAQDAHPVQFEDVVTELAARHPDKNIAILFDEVDSLLNFDRLDENQETLFRSFRSLSNEKRCQYVFSGEKWLMRSIADPYSALFNFTQAVRLQPLPPKVVRQLVADPFEMLNIWMEQSEQVINRIYQISAGHPNIVQMICQAMVEELDQDPQNASLLTIEHLDQATSRRTLQEEIVQTIWGQMSPLARLITLTWPEGQRFLSLSDIEQLLAEVGLPHVPPESLERTARDLELYCFVRPRENDQLELIPMAFPAILDFMTDKRRQIEIVRRHYEADPQGAV